MPREKKDGRRINYYIVRKVYESVEQHAREKGQTMTMAIERLLAKGLEAERAEQQKLYGQNLDYF